MEGPRPLRLRAALSLIREAKASGRFEAAEARREADQGGLRGPDFALSATSLFYTARPIRGEARG